MVMETPSAQCVGREFVRQYYTLLHEAPNYLHRFYSHNSCFVHGGVEKPGEEQPPVMGQNDIHKKILDLKFKDCHAKIRQVDSQPTVGNAVVVQVTGELSNNRQPMRRFMQTFILAPQSPKKYYVHNDIFRYQDEVFHDLDGGVDSSAQQVTAELDGQDMQKEVEVEEAIPEQEPAQPEPAYYDAPQQQPPAMSNGTGQMEKAADSQEEFNAAPAEEVVEEQPAAAFEPAVEKEEEPEPAPAPVPEVPQQPQEPPKPVSWAAMASQRPAQQSAAAPQQPAVRVAPIKPAVVADAAGKQPQDAKPQPPRPPRQQRDRQRGDNRAAGAAPGAPVPAPENQDNGTAEPRQRDRVQGPPQSMYPDAVQLFVGNLPHNIEEAELKDFFEKDYGKVIDVRINRKRDRDVPVSKNFGFVIFQSAETVQKVLAQKPIMLRDIRLNVEEKKQRGEGGRPGSGTRMGGRGGRSGGGGQGGQGGMGGGPRGGGRGGAGGAPRGGQGNGRGGFGGGNRR